MSDLLVLTIERSSKKFIFWLLLQILSLLLMRSRDINCW